MRPIDCNFSLRVRRGILSRNGLIDDSIPVAPRRSDCEKRSFLRSLPFVVVVVLGLGLQLRAQVNEAENAQEVSGFWGQVTGKVKSAQADGGGFVLSINKAVVDLEKTSLKESAPLLGKELAIGVRMPKNAAGVASRHPDDVAYIKTLKPGMVITVKIFAPRANPRVSRIQGPGQSAEGTPGAN